MYPVSVPWLPLQIMTTKLQKTDKVCTLEQTVGNFGTFSNDYDHSMLFVKTETLTGSLKSYFLFYVDDTKLDIVNYGEETSFLLLVCWVSPQSISSEIA